MSATDELRRMLDARLAALIECCDETDRLIIDTRRFADLEDENAKLREQGERLFDKTLELATENVELYDENARLRSCLSDDAENARMIMAENSKLREIVRDMRKAFFALDIDHCQSCPRDTINGPCTKHLISGSDECNFEEEMRELGIEVDE